MSAQRAGRIAGLLLAGCALSAHALPVHGAEPTKRPAAKTAPPDLEFLEYLGTLESDEENWQDVAKVDLRHGTKAKDGGPKAKGKGKTEAEATAKTESNGK